LTAKRRLGLLTGRGLVFADPRRFFSITDAGREALGDATLPPRWVRVEAISAASAKDGYCEKVGNWGAAKNPSSARRVLPARVVAAARPKRGSYAERSVAALSP
jgi:hypothetical protein